MSSKIDHICLTFIMSRVLNLASQILFKEYCGLAYGQLVHSV